MKNETLEAFLEYIKQVEVTIKSVMSMGSNAPMTDFANATARLYEALQNEDIAP